MIMANKAISSKLCEAFSHEQYSAGPSQSHVLKHLEPSPSQRDASSRTYGLRGQTNLAEVSALGPAAVYQQQAQESGTAQEEADTQLANAFSPKDRILSKRIDCDLEETEVIYSH